MPSEQIQELIAGYVLGDLEPDEANAFEQLLTTDPAIAHEVAQVQQALELSYNPTPVEPPAHLRMAIVQAATQDVSTTSAATPAANPSATNTMPLRSRTVQWNRWLGVAAAGLIAVLGVNNLRLWQTVKVLEERQQQYETLTYSLQSLVNAQNASVTITVDPNTLQASLAVANLPPPPPGKVYAIWTLPQQGTPFTTDDKGAILTGTFEVDAEGNIDYRILVPPVFRTVDLVDKVAISLEDAEAPQQHQGTPIMITDL
ncbi:anti-sigma factor [Leptolyngbya sp. AN02str]|uniref:anti-sigma factor n=1 Tax=Leptolyngbya sp. AN02str TaxID=3423363 RepID=UPI003D30F4CF